MKCHLLLAQKFIFKIIEGKLSYWIRKDGIQWNNSYKTYASRKEVSDLLLLLRWWSVGSFRFQYLLSNDWCLQSPSTKTWVRFHISPCGICIGPRGTGIEVFFLLFRFSLSVSFRQCSILTFTSYANNANTAEREVNEIFLPIQKETRASQKKVMGSCRQCREYEAHRTKLINTVRNGPEPYQFLYCSYHSN